MTDDRNRALLEAVEATFARSNEALRARDEATRAASEAGYSLRELATVAGVAHTTIKRIIRKG
jgi:hypothetical protein